MHSVLKKLLHGTGIVLLVYGIYCAVFGIFSYLLPMHTEKTEKPEAFFGDPEKDGPDRAALIEAPAEAFPRRVELIRSAEHSLDLVCHCVKKGESTDCLFAELLAAADRGVHVRVLLDGMIGGLTGEHKNIDLALLAHPNIEYRAYNPVRWLKPWGFNARLHDKFMLADDRLLMLGGRNIGDEYFDPPGYTGRVTHDRDVVVWNTGNGADSVTKQAKAYMEELWTAKETAVPSALSAGQTEKGLAEQKRLRDIAARWEAEFPAYYLPAVPVEELTVPTRKISILANPLGDFKKEPLLGATAVRILRDCSSIRIQTPYATANRYMLGALRQLGERADTAFLTNSITSTPNYPAFSTYCSQKKKFLETGIRIYEYQSTDSIHGKSCTADGHLSMVGSFNLDDRSLYIDTESVLVIDSPQFCEILNEKFDALFASAAEVGADGRYVPGQAVEIPEPPAGKRFLMGAVSLVARIFQFLI